MPRRTLYLDSFAGIAGDMFTAAFLDAGLVDPDAVRSVPSLLGLQDVQVSVSAEERAGARFTNLQVVVPTAAPGQAPAGHHPHHHHHYNALVERLEKSALDPVALNFALRVFRLLAEAEAHSHGVPLKEVAFHEVGDVDSVVDVAMAGVCVAAVKPDRVMASPIKLGRGTVRIQHGTYPVPPPASARLAVGMPVASVPNAITKADVELSTPTGLAILRALEPEFAEGWPAGTLMAQGSGAGTRDLGKYPNVFRVALLEEPFPGLDASASPSPYRTDRVAEIRCNVDDQTGERTAWLMKKGLELGAVDGWVSQVVGKKGRPSLVMTFLAAPDLVPPLTDFLLRHSSTFGVRFGILDRYILDRDDEVRETRVGPVSFKVGRNLDGSTVKEKPEYDDLERIWEDEPDFDPGVSEGEEPELRDDP